MHIYLILLLARNEAVGEKVLNAYPDNFTYNDTTYLVTDPSPLTENIAIKAGIKGDGRVSEASGFVVKLGSAPSYSGYTVRSLWDWLSAAAEKAQ